MEQNKHQRLDFGFVNAYLIRADRGFVLIDTGTAGHRARLGAALAEAGCTGDKLRLVVLTHADYDHAGNASWLRETFGSPIAIHAGDAPMLETGVAPPRYIRGLLGRLLTPILALRRGGGPTCRPDILLEDSQELRPWGLAARVVHLSGHTPGAIGILAEDGAFFAGDVFANWRRPAASPFIHDAGSYRVSIARARELVPAEATVHPGHGGPFPAGELAKISL